MSEPLRFLILEDNPDDAELTQFELQKAGMAFTSKVVMTEEDFVRAIQDFSPNLILSDYDLPQYTGALALAEAKKRCPDTPFILVTGAVTEDRAIDILTQGARDYVLKNRLDQRLVPAVRRALAEAEEHRARKQAEAELREAYRTLEERVKIRTAELETEVAARKRTETALRDSECRERRRADELTRILDAVPTPVFIVHDADAAHMTGNSAAAELLQQPRGAEVSLSAPTETKPRHFKAFKKGRELKLDELPAQRAARGDQVKDFEFDLVFDDGTIRHVLGYGTPLLDEREHPRGAVHVLVDITGRKRAEEALRESESKYRNLFENMTEEVHFWQVIRDESDQIKTWRLVDANPPALRTWGSKTLEEIKGKTTDEIFGPGATDHYLPVVKKIFSEGVPYVFEDYFPHLDKHFRFTSIPIGEYFITTGADITPIKSVQEALHAREVALSEAQRLAHIGSWHWDAQTDVTIGTDELLRIYGFDPATQTIPNFIDQRGLWYPPEEWGRLNAAVQESARTGAGYDLEVQALRNGQCIWVQTRSEAVCDAGGRIVGLRGTVQDITQRKQAEDALRESEEQFRVLTQNLVSAVALINEHGEITIVNKSFLRLFDLSEDADILNINSRDWSQWQVFDEDGRLLDVDEHPVRKAARMRSPVRDVLVAIQCPGRMDRKWLLISAEAILDAQGNLHRLICTYHDITARRQAEEALRESEARFRLALKNSPVVVAMQDCDLVYRWAFNTRTRGSDDVIGKTDADLFAPEDTPLILEAKSNVLRTGGVVHHQQWLTSNGRRVFLDSYYEPVRDSAGKIIGVGTAAVNLTEQKRAEEALKEANQELEAFSYSVSHDLRAPLRHISGYAGMMREHLENSTDEATTRYVTGITRAAKNMATLIDDLLAFSRIGRNALNKKKFRFDDLVAEVVREMENEAKGRDIEWNIGDFPEVYGDPSLLKLALVNLVSNAVKFTGNEKQAQIAIGCKEEKEGFVLFVKDNGVGFDMKYVDKLFGVFRRLHTQTEFEGTGVGLANVKRIISRHGGKTWAEGAVGQGATFFFMLPMSE